MKPIVNLAVMHGLSPYGSYITGSAIIGNFDIESDIDIDIPIGACADDNRDAPFMQRNINWETFEARSV